MKIKREFVLLCRQAPFVQFVVREALAVIGRLPSCDYVVVDASVSRRHAQLRSVDEGIEITDLRSRNGTIVANRRIQAEIVSANEVVRFGDIEFTVTVIESASEEVTDEPRDFKGLSSSICEVLSEAQRRVFDLLLYGLPEKKIAKQLKLSPHTIHNHTRAIYSRFGVHSRSQLLALFTKTSMRRTSVNE